MSDYLFPRARSKARLELRLAVLAVVLLTCFGVFALWLGASFVGIVGGDVRATARLVSVGDSLGINSSVKFRGLRVGRVVRVSTVRDAEGTYGATVVIDRQYADEIPAGVVARVLPGTLFGAEYVDLVVPRSTVRLTVSTGGADRTLSDGAVIPADTSLQAVRLMDTFSAMERVIGAIDPQSLDLALSQLADALAGKGDDLRRFIGRADRLVRGYAGVEPTFYRDLALMSRNLRTLAGVEPGIAAVLRNSLPVARTVAGKARAIDRVMRYSTRLAAEISRFLEQHGRTFTRLVDEVAPTYREFVRGRPAFSAILREAPTVLFNGAASIAGGAIQMLAYLGVSADHRNPYTAADCSRYGSMAGSNCP